MGKLKDLTGMKFGRLTVLERAENHKGRVAWYCICDCGGHTIVTGHDLNSGDTKSCGCLNHEKIVERAKGKLVSLVGCRFGRLTVIDRSDDVGRNPAWRCACDCGNETIVRSTELKNGSTKSCGCYGRERSSESKLIDLTGKKYGDLTVIRKVGRECHSSLWECKCICGAICYVRGNQLRGHTVIGCPKCDDKSSKGEKRISLYLQNKNIEFESQKRFSDCRYKRTLPFDFYIPSQNIVIEYDGEQHFRPVNLGGISDESAMKAFRLTQKRDAIKNQYCQTNDIQLIRIPYTQFDSIETILNQQLA